MITEDTLRQLKHELGFSTPLQVAYGVSRVTCREEAKFEPQGSSPVSQDVHIFSIHVTKETRQRHRWRPKESDPTHNFKVLKREDGCWGGSCFVP